MGEFGSRGGAVRGHMPFFEIVEPTPAGAELEQITVRQINTDGTVEWVQTTVTQLLGHDSRGEQEGWTPVIQSALSWGVQAVQVLCAIAAALFALWLLRWYVLRLFSAFCDQYGTRAVHSIDPRARQERERMSRELRKKCF